MVAMEFLSSKGLVRGEKQWTKLTHFCEEERPLAIQIYGSDAATMAEAARMVEELRPDVCDINMGCPANKVLKGCAGAALMGDLKLAEQIIRQVRKELSIPLTVKFRLGLDEQRQTYLELGRLCEANGVDAELVPGRQEDVVVAVTVGPQHDVSAVLPRTEQLRVGHPQVLVVVVTEPTEPADFEMIIH